MKIVGTMRIDFRGTSEQVIYRRTDDDCEFWFEDDDMNDLPLTGQERRDIRREILLGGEQ